MKLFRVLAAAVAGLALAACCGVVSAVPCGVGDCGCEPDLEQLALCDGGMLRRCVLQPEILCEGVVLLEYRYVTTDCALPAPSSVRCAQITTICYKEVRCTWVVPPTGGAGYCQIDYVMSSQNTLGTMAITCN